MTLLLFFNAPASSGATGTAFQSFVEAGMFLGNWDIDDYLTFTACTHDEGAAADADAVPSYAVYEDETAVAIVSGNMAKLGAVTGFYTERIQLTAANGFEAGKCYAVRVEAVMGGVTAAAAHSFAVKVASANVTYWAGDPVNDLVGGEVPANLTSTSEQVIANATKLLPGAGLAAIGSVANILPTLPTDADVQAAAAAALTAYDPPTAAELTSAVAPLALEATAQEILLDTGTTLPAAIAVIDSNVDAVKLITDELDATAVTQVAASSAGHLTITAGLTFDEAVTGLTIPADWVTAIWTLKYSAEQADTAAVIQMRAENPADPLTDGLLRVNGVAPASPITAADGSLTVTQASGRIDIWLSDELTALLSRATGLGWDVKFIDADDDSSGRRGTADVVLTETKAVV